MPDNLLYYSLLRTGERVKEPRRKRPEEGARATWDKCRFSHRSSFAAGCNACELQVAGYARPCSYILHVMHVMLCCVMLRVMHGSRSGTFPRFRESLALANVPKSRVNLIVVTKCVSAPHRSISVCYMLLCYNCNRKRNLSQRIVHVYRYRTRRELLYRAIELGCVPNRELRVRSEDESERLINWLIAFAESH